MAGLIAEDENASEDDNIYTISDERREIYKNMVSQTTEKYINEKLAEKLADILTNFCFLWFIRQQC